MYKGEGSTTSHITLKLKSKENNLYDMSNGLCTTCHSGGHKWSECTEEPCGKSAGSPCDACQIEGADYYILGECGTA